MARGTEFEDHFEAMEALKESGAVEECEVHSDYWLDQLDSGAAEEAVENLAEVYGKEKAAAMVEAALSELPDECGYCAKD